MIIFTLGSLAEASIGLKITIPSENDRKIAPHRDFLVMGTISRDVSVAASFDIRVVVSRADDDTTFRYLRSILINDTGVTSQEAVSTDYYMAASWSEKSADKLRAEPLPDLIYDPTSPDSFGNQNVKVAVTSDKFSALIFGGATSLDINGWETMSKLEEGNYRIVVSAMSGDYELASDDRELTVGVVEHKLLSRFSNGTPHWEKINEFARDKGCRIYIDNFPGNYWNGGNPYDYSYEIPARWRANDTWEYRAGHIHTILYNIDDVRCATQKVEIGYLADCGDISSDRVEFYRYDIGEPLLLVNGAQRDGKLVKLAKGDKLELVRAEIRGEGVESKENYFVEASQDVVEGMFFNEDISGGKINVNPGKTLSLYGVAVPIPASADIGTGADGAGNYNVRNYTQTVRYELKNGDTTLLSRDAKIALVRRYDGKAWDEYDSIYEFKHDFPISQEYRNSTLNMSLFALDKNGAVIPGTEESFDIHVGSSDSSGGCNAGWGGLLIAAAALSVIKLKRRR
ncbi:MAG: hypothetical protein Q4D58_05040 [Synergistaceae bacterium]|nr:hypothetical protein [Synergistaceae bacterium]